MLVSVNGEARELPAGATVAAVIGLLSDTSNGAGAVVAPEGRGVAVAVSGEVVPRRQWETTELSEGARVEVVAAVQGG